MYTKDEHFLDSINTEEKAYFMGFMFADGSNCEKKRRFDLNLNSKDIEILEKFKCLLKSNAPLKFRAATNSHALRICNRRLSDRLTELGCHPRKSFTIQFPDWLEAPLVNHFIRGYNDGDGCFYSKGKNSINRIIGADLFIDRLANIIKISCNVNVGIERHPISKGISTLNISGTQQVKRVINYFYKDATIYLTRKKNIADLILSKPIVLASKLTSANVLSIKALLIDGATHDSIANVHGVSSALVNCIAVGKRRANITGFTADSNLRREYSGCVTLTKTQVLEIVDLLNKGVGVNEIAKHYPVKHQAISKIKLGQRWSHLTGIMPT